MPDPTTSVPSSSTDRHISGLKPPDKLTLGCHVQESWRLFRQRWETYSILTNVASKPREVQVALFLHCLDDDALRAYNGLSFTSEECERTVPEILDKFHEYAIGHVNETYERFLFNQRVQKETEPFEIFISDLRRLLKSCNFCSNCSDSLLRDRIVIGIRDNDTQKEMLKTQNLSLTHAIDICKAAETATIQRRNISRPLHVNAVAKHSSHQRQQASSSQKKRCIFCDKNHPFGKSQCPAFGKNCKKCGKKNHFSKVCRSKTVHQIDASEQSSNESPTPPDWVNTVNADAKLAKCQMILNKQAVSFLIDSGASVNVLPKRYAGNLIPGRTSIVSYGGNSMTSLGNTREILLNPKNKKRHHVEFVVCDKDLQPILGLLTAQKMGLITLEESNFEKVTSLQSYTDLPVFQEGIGTFPGVQTLKTDPTVKPVIMPNRRVPIAVRSKLKQELDYLEEAGVITPVTEPTPWVSQIVTAKKPNGDVRVCIDPKFLNKALMRERYTIPLLEDVLHELSESRVFTKVDLRHGFWHILLDEESSKLTTMQTTFGRYRWLRLPMGLNVSGEIFVRKVLELFGQLPGLVAIHDDIIVHGRDKETHDCNLKLFLDKCQEYGVKLNKDKFVLASSSITFMGHIIDANGLTTDPSKVKAITGFPQPSCVSDVRRFLGMVQYLARFIPNLTDILHPIQNLTKKDVAFMWSETQEQAFAAVKKAIAESPQLSFYAPDKELTVENDASDYGIGSVLLQEQRPIAFASRTLTSAERNYCQLEKEMLAVTYGLKKFHQYTYGRPTTVVTDHKPIVAISRKPLSRAPKRLQRMFLNIQEYDTDIVYKPGSELFISDSLSRAPLPETEVIESVSNLQYTPFNNDRLDQIRAATVLDADLTQLKLVIMQGWPEAKQDIPNCLHPYFHFRDELTVQEGIILRGERVVIPQSMRNELKTKVHAGHQGINSCLRRARDLIYWPGMSAEIRQFVESCDICAGNPAASQPEQPLITHDVPSAPWEVVGADIFHVKGRNYHILVDYFSNYIEVDFLSDISANTVIHKIKAQFARHGIPRKLISDSGTQYTSEEFATFAKTWQFRHHPSAPGNHRANGAAEAAVKIVKALMLKCSKAGEDPYLGLLNLRNTPNEGLTTSPAQRLFGRRTQTGIPTAQPALKPSQIPISERKLLENRKFKQSQKNIERPALPLLNNGDTVRMQPIDKTKEWRKATVVENLGNNTYKIFDGSKFFRRHTQFLRKQKEQPANQEQGLKTRSGRNVTIPQKLVILNKAKSYV